MEFLGETLGVIGKVMVAYAAVRVHHRVLNEHKIDSHVFKIMKREQFFGILGICFILLGYFVEHYSVYLGLFA